MGIHSMKYFLAEAQSSGLDGSGECGSLVHYGFVLLLVGGAFLAFAYLWKKNKLDMDEEPKIQMMEDKENKEDLDGK